MDISILIPGIRNDLWMNVYNSAAKSFSGKWEIIFVGPYIPSEEIRALPNVQFILSWASPLVCRQIAFLHARGKYLCWAADDVTFCEGSLDEAFNTIKDKDYMTMVVGKYAEGEGRAMVDDDNYWRLNHHGFLKPTMRVMPKDFFLINTGLVSHQLMTEIGGWDCQFECCAMGCCDLSLRLQIRGGRGILQNNPIFCSTHLVNDTGDHEPIHEGQTKHDEPLFREIWEDKEYAHRVCIEANNHLNQPGRWLRRFPIEA